MALLPLRQAADAVGVSRQTLYRYVKDGRISATIGHSGEKVVDTTELLRVFGKLGTPAAPETAVTGSGDSLRQPETAVTARDDSRERAEAARMGAELAAAQVLLDVTRNELADAREREAKLLDVIQSQTRLLEYRAPEPTVKPTSPWPWIALVSVAAVAIVAVVVTVIWAAPNRTPLPVPAAAPAVAPASEPPAAPTQATDPSPPVPAGSTSTE